jgi:HD-GYP domain-containing protein (c-di-GMP phosphodiesterase class II)
MDAGWVVRAGAMMLVGWVCGTLNRSLLRRVEDLETLNRETIFAFVRAIDARDPYTARHSEKVATYAVELAQALGLSPAACERLRLAGLLHDVGKLALERSVLHKAGPLSDDEWRQVREHPGLSAHILGGVAHFAAFLPAARHHHEWHDGRGYPDGLAGTEIPLDARVLAVADAYDAMTSDRSYRAALTHAEAMGRLKAGAGSQFDPVCVAAFATLKLDPARIDEAMVPLLDLKLLPSAA